MGERPTHPELLDWLAVEFMNKGWSLKQLHRLMMTSEAYQMVSAYDHGGNVKQDPENLLRGRSRPQRQMPRRFATTYWRPVAASI